MTKYERLISEAEYHGAKVIELDLGTDKPCGKCINNIIFVNNNITTSEKIGILAEELGHFHKTVGDIRNQNIINNRKQEILARRWGYERLVGIIGLIRAFENNCKNSYEVADFLGISKEYLDEAIDYFKCKYGDMYEIDGYIIYFSNGLGICKIF